MSITINKLEIENVKRVKAVKLTPNGVGLTIVGGDNNQGKTSVLDAIAWALGGDSYKPSQAHRDGSVTDPYLHLVLSNGLIVERKGKNSDLKVIDPSGEKAGQQLLNSFIEKLALDLPKFMEANNSEKANILLKIIGVGDKLAELELREKELYNERLAIGRIADKKKKFAEEQEYYPDAPNDLVSATDLIKEQQDILARNGENQRKRDVLSELKNKASFTTDEIEKLNNQIKDLQDKLKEKNETLTLIEGDIITANKTVEQLIDESTEELERNLSEIEEINRKVRANLDKDKAEEDALDYANQYNSLSTDIDNVRKEKTELLNKADLPLEGLTVEEGRLKYKGYEWDNLSGSDKLKVSTAIVRKLNPECGFVLMDKLEQMDNKTLKDFGEWLETEGLQVIATRVSTGDECSIIIEDGYSKEVKHEVKKEWAKGVF